MLYYVSMVPAMDLKKVSIIEDQLLGQIMKYTKCLSYPLPFFANWLNNPFLNLRISANHDKMNRLSANVLSLQWWYPYKGDCFSIIESYLFVWMGAKGKGKLSLSAFSHETSEYHLEDWANNNISNPLCTSISVWLCSYKL